MMFSTRNLWNLDLGIEWVLRCKAMELESLRCIVSRLERVVVARPTYALFSLETQGTFEHIYRDCVIKNFGGGFKFVVVNDKSYIFGRVGRENIFWDKVF